MFSTGWVIASAACITILIALPIRGDSILDQLENYEFIDIGAVPHSSRRRLFEQVGNKDVVFDLVVLGRSLSVHLERYDSLFAGSYQHYLLGEYGKSVEIEEKPQCIYRSKASNRSFEALVSLCSEQLHMTLLDHRNNGNESFTIQPVSEDSTKHVAYFHRHLRTEGTRTCGVTEIALDYEDESFSTGEDHGRMLQGSGIKYIGVAVINDYERFRHRGKFVHAHSAFLFSVANQLFSKLGTEEAPSGIQIRLEIVAMYTFTVADPWTHDSTQSTSLSNVPLDEYNEISASGLLSAVNYWRRLNILPKQDTSQLDGHDVAHLLTGYTFTGNTIGMAHVHGVCEVTSRSGVTQAYRLTDAQIASTIAHEIGHNLGMFHTGTPPEGFSQSCTDTDESYFIMAKTSSASVAHTNWDPCSIEYLTRHFNPANGRYPGSNQGTFSQCAETPSAGSWSTSEPVCGDGLVQGTEQCDCIDNDCSLVDPCCHGSNCTLKEFAECSAQEGCCSKSTCKIITDTSTVCRPPVSSCDVVERCNGISPRCPLDLFKLTGTACVTSNFNLHGTCYQTECKDAAEECIIRGLQQSDASLQWDDTCSNEDTGFYAYPRTSACSIRCKRPSPSEVCDSYEQEQFYEDGTQCDQDKGCYRGVCTPFELIPVPVNVNCLNLVVDADETDLDCGGACYGCDPGKLCAVDRDCLYPSTCNLAETFTNPVNGKTGLGKCLAPPPAPPSWYDVYYWVSEWFRNNYHIWGPIAAGILILLILLALCCRKRQVRIRNERKAAGTEGKQESMTTLGYNEAAAPSLILTRELGRVGGSQWNSARQLQGLHPTDGSSYKGIHHTNSSASLGSYLSSVRS